MNNKSSIIFTVIMAVSLIFIFLNMGIHIGKTKKFNRKTYTVSSPSDNSECMISVAPRGGLANSWDKVDVNVNNKILTLTGMTYDVVFQNISKYQVKKWSIKINITEDCWINKAWCGTVEIHQDNKFQTLDLRNFEEDSISLEHFYVGQDLLIPLKKGDFVIYNPDATANEFPVNAFNGAPGQVTVGFIFYKIKGEEFNLNDILTNFMYRKNYFQGTEPKIFIILLTLWIIVILIKIAFVIAWKKAEEASEKEMTQKRLDLAEKENKFMSEYNSRLNNDVEEKTAHIENIQRKIVLGLADIIGNRDENTGGHVKRTSDIIEYLVHEIQIRNPIMINDLKARAIVRAAPMHDLGKLAIDNNILCKPGKLTEDEYNIMKTHSSKSGEIVKSILEGVEEELFVNTAFNIARFHHERWDGAGYPDKLAGEEIPLEARIMAVADVYDALVSRRCYKEPLSFEQASEIMCEGMGSQFDPSMKEIFLSCREKLEEYYSENK